MTSEIKTIVLSALRNYRGDDYPRAKAAFVGQDLSQMYGYSGKSKGEILTEYREHWEKVSRAIEEIENV